MLNRVIKLFKSNYYAYLVIFSALLSFLILWKVPQFQVSHFNTTITDPVIIAQLEDKFRSTIAQILGGIAILVGLYLTNKRVVATEKNLVIVEQGQITERFTRAIEHLGKDGLEFKLGGIYALERIANESKKDHWPIMEILTAYIRKNSPIHVSEKAEEHEQAYCKLSIDTQAALDVFKRRKLEHEGKEVRTFDLNQTYLREANLSKANLSKANLSEANLSEADLSKADLSKATLSGANLSEANLSGTIFENNKLDGIIWGENKPDFINNNDK